jgi:PhnB protein
MGSDSPPAHDKTPAGFAVSLAVDTSAEAERIFAAFADGGGIGMPMGETSFAEKFGVCTDRFGTRWMVVCQKPMG